MHQKLPGDLLHQRVPPPRDFLTPALGGRRGCDPPLRLGDGFGRAVHWPRAMPSSVREKARRRCALLYAALGERTASAGAVPRRR
jgi:hypothetical protein